MTAETPAPDRRLAQKQRTREQILAAAAALIEGDLPGRFSVDELVEQADVSRRTIFNHFESLDEILIHVGVERLHIFSDALETSLANAAEPLDRSAVLAIFADVLDTDVLPEVIAYFMSTMGMKPSYTAHSHQLFHGAFTHMSEEIVEQIVSASDVLDRFDADLIIATVIAGMETVAEHWLNAEPLLHNDGASITPESRIRFHALFARLAATWRAGEPPHLHEH
ncbi:TetR/AcrR family transcriptional regulator [Agrococcus casei]|uniref:TetR/AcrR family transcriptional regulator n=2 Tax=Agrococcus casei TaxID=343512 RepID=UPI003F92C356